MPKKRVLKLNFLTIKIFTFFLISNLIPIHAKPFLKEVQSNIDVTYLESKNELEDYILDTGDELLIEFKNSPELTGSSLINEQGEIYLNRIKETYVRGLTVKELERLLEERYGEFLINPEINIRFKRYKSIRVAIKGEVRNPGIIKFGAFDTSNTLIFKNNNDSLVNSSTESLSPDQNINSNDTSLIQESASTIDIKRSSDFITTISNAINKAGGISSFSDLSKIEVIRDIPLGKGGGKKKATVDLTSFLEGTSSEMDIRLFDGDIIFIPKLQKKDPSILPTSILAGLTPKFINVSITGKIENPGSIKIPLEGTLSDAMNIAGPRKPLSGKIFIFRYGKDGSLERKLIKYSANATPGAERNPYLFNGDIIAVKNSVFGKTSGILTEISSPFIGIYATKELVESF